MRAERLVSCCRRGLKSPRLAVFVVVLALFAGGLFLGAAYASWPDEVAAGDAVEVSSSTDDTTTQAPPDPPTETSPPDTETVVLPPDPEPTTTQVEVVDPPPPSPPPPPTPTQPTGSNHLPDQSHGTHSPAPAGHTRPPEIGEGGYATIWLHRILSDPLPSAARLSPKFARQLRGISARAGLRWSDVLAVARSRGAHGAVPMRRKALQRLVTRLADHPRKPLLAAAHGDVRLANELRALSRYNRAVGLAGLVRGLEAAKPALARKVLRDERIEVYAAGRADIASGRVDVRVLVLLRYLAIGFHEVSVTSLISGHGFFARPGIVSAHMSGLGADIAAVGGVPINGHQSPGGITERAIQAILLLPRELHPQQVVSLLGLGGASFALPDHYDHIHVGF
jgi:hypothetical protein